MERLMEKYVLSEFKNIKKDYKTIERTEKSQHCTLKYRLISPKNKDYTSLKEIAKDLELSYHQIWRIYKNKSSNHPTIKICSI